MTTVWSYCEGRFGTWSWGGLDNFWPLWKMDDLHLEGAELADWHPGSFPSGCSSPGPSFQTYKSEIIDDTKFSCLQNPKQSHCRLFFLTCVLPPLHRPVSQGSPSCPTTAPSHQSTARRHSPHWTCGRQPEHREATAVSALPHPPPQCTAALPPPYALAPPAVRRRPHKTCFHARN